MNLDLTKKNALVCGSTQGIGKASAPVAGALAEHTSVKSRTIQVGEQWCNFGHW